MAVVAGVVALGVLLACEAVLLLGEFEFLENASFDARVHLLPPPHPPSPVYPGQSRGERSRGTPPEIVIIDIDNPSFAALRDAVGRWPWTRLLWAELVKYLHAAGARLIVFDAIFAGRESAEVDREFAQAMAAAGNVILAAGFVDYEAELAPGAAPPTPETIPGALPVVDAVGLPPLAPQQHQPDLPLDELGQAARALGWITLLPDSDGVVRRLPLFFRWNDRYYPSLALAAAAAARGLAPDTPPRLTRSEFQWGAVRVPVTPDGMLVPHWRPQTSGETPGRMAAYPRLPLWQVACSIFPEVCEEQKRFFEPEHFRGKIVLIGASAASVFDLFATPVAPVTPGFLIHAAVLESLLRGRAVMQPPPYLTHLSMFLLAALVLAAVWGLGRVSHTTLLVAGLLLLYTAGAAWVFQRWDVWLPVAAPLGTLLASFLVHSVARYATTGRELRRTRQTLSRYMSPKVVELILAHGGPDQLRGQRRRITVLFSDIRNFTQLSERRSPAEVLTLLTRYLDAMTEIVFRHDGVVDKFIGDGMLCYWGAFGDADRHARQAARAAAEMVAKGEELNENWRAEGLPELNIGIGINTGEAVFGNLGAGKKVEFTVLGDTVNVASRLEGLNKEFGTRIILGETTQAELGPALSRRFLGEVQIRGREQKMKVYELLGLSPEEERRET